MKLSAAFVAIFGVPAVSGFLAPTTSQKSTTLSMGPQDGLKKAAVSAVAAAFLATNLVPVDPAFAAVDGLDFGSSQMVAARSGGRAGGRSSAARAPPRASSSSTTHVIHRTTYVAPSPVIVSPPVGYGYGYNPMPGLGLSIGLNAVGQIGNEFREYRQENEIRDTRAQLQNSQIREAELEARLRQLEQANQNNQLNQQQQEQMKQMEAMLVQMQQSK